MYAVVRIGITITMIFSRRNEKEKTLCDFRKTAILSFIFSHYLLKQKEK